MRAAFLPKGCCIFAIHVVFSALFNLRTKYLAGISMKTFNATAETVQRQWHIIDADGKTLGRMATEIAVLLRGKNKPEYTPHVDTGDYVVVINAEKVKVTGNKAEGKVYYRHTGYPGGLKERTFSQMQEHAPERIIELAVKGMLPKNPLGRAMYRKLKIYAGDQHPHVAQQPSEFKLKVADTND